MRVFNGISFETGARTHKYFKPRGGKYSARKKRQMGAILVQGGPLLTLKSTNFQKNGVYALVKYIMYWRDKNVLTYEKFAHPWISKEAVGFS